MVFEVEIIFKWINFFIESSWVNKNCIEDFLGVFEWEVFKVIFYLIGCIEYYL